MNRLQIDKETAGSARDRRCGAHRCACSRWHKCGSACPRPKPPASSSPKAYPRGRSQATLKRADLDPVQPGAPSQRAVQPYRLAQPPAPPRRQKTAPAARLAITPMPFSPHAFTQQQVEHQPDQREKHHPGDQVENGVKIAVSLSNIASPSAFQAVHLVHINAVLGAEDRHHQRQAHRHFCRGHCHHKEDKNLPIQRLVDTRRRPQKPGWRR